MLRNTSALFCATSNHSIQYNPEHNYGEANCDGVTIFSYWLKSSEIDFSLGSIRATRQVKIYRGKCITLCSILFGIVMYTLILRVGRNDTPFKYPPHEIFILYVSGPVFHDLVNTKICNDCIIPPTSTP